MKTNNPHNPILSKAILSVLAGLVISGQTLADEYHYKDILVGDRAAGLGGAYTAVADDASGLYYNPAGIVYASAPKISGSVNAYNYKTTEYSNLNANTNQKWVRTSSGMVANYFGATQPLGDNSTVGFSIAIPNYDLEDQSDEFTNFAASTKAQGLGITQIDRQQIDFNNQDSTTLAGVSYATSINKDMSIGLTLYGYMRKKELTNWQHVRASGTNLILDGSYYQKIQTEELGLQPRLGLMWAPAEKLSLGLMVQTTFMLSQKPETRVQSTYNLCDTSVSPSTCTTYDNNLDALDLAGVVPASLSKTRDNELPVEVNLGAAYFANNQLMYTTDFSYATQNDVYEATWNLAGGVEYFLNPTWAVRGGLYTNNANTNSNVAVYKEDHVNLYGGSFSLSRYTKGSNITAGINYSAGSGQADLLNSSSRVQNVSVNSMNLFISTSASF